MEQKPFTASMEQKPSTAKIALKWGAITGVALIIYSTILFTVGGIGNTSLSLISYAIMIGGIIMAMREYRTLNDGFMSYGAGIGVGTLSTTVAGLLSSTYTVFYMMFIDKNIMQGAMDKAREQLEANGSLSDEQIEQQLKFMDMFQSPGLMFLFGVLGSAFLGLIFSLVIAAILKKDKPVFE